MLSESADRARGVILICNQYSLGRDFIYRKCVAHLFKCETAINLDRKHISTASVFTLWPISQIEEAAARSGECGNIFIAFPKWGQKLNEARLRCEHFILKDNNCFAGERFPGLPLPLSFAPGRGSLPPHRILRREKFYELIRCAP